MESLKRGSILVDPLLILAKKIGFQVITPKPEVGKKREYHNFDRAGHALSNDVFKSIVSAQIMSLLVFLFCEKT